VTAVSPARESPFLGEFIDDVECGEDALRGVDHRRDHGYVPVKLQETIAVRRALIMKTPDAAVCRGATDPGRT